MKIKVTVPETLADIKLSQYQKFLKTTKDSEDVNWINKQTIGIFCNMPDDLVTKLTKRDYDKLLTKVVSVINTETSKHQPIIVYNGKEYGFIPNLDEITVGEQADIDSMIGDWSKMDRVMAILYRPIKIKKGGRYLINDYTAEEEPLDLTMDIVNGAMVFFYDLLNDLLNYTQSFMREAVNQPKILQTLGKNGVGINQYMASLEVIFSNLRQLKNLNYIKP